MGSNIIATLNEAFATAPGITAIDLAVLTRMPDTQRLGIVAYGRWTRQAVASVPWRRPEDALRFLDIAEDVDCSVRTTASGNLSTSVKPLDTTKIPGLEALLAQIEDVPEATPEPAAPPPSDPYALKSFAEWKQATAPAPPLQAPPQPWSLPTPAPSLQPPPPHPAAPQPAHSFHTPPPQHAAPAPSFNTPPAQSAAPYPRAPHPGMAQGTNVQVAAPVELAPGQTLVQRPARLETTRPRPGLGRRPRRPGPRPRRRCGLIPERGPSANLQSIGQAYSPRVRPHQVRRT